MARKSKATVDANQGTLPFVMENKNAQEAYSFPISIKDIRYLRATSFGVLDECPKQWAAKFLIGMDVDTVTTFSALDIPVKPSAGQIGTAVHLMAEEYETKGIKPLDHPAIAWVPKKEQKRAIDYIHDEIISDEHDLVALELEIEMVWREGEPPLKMHIDRLTKRKDNPGVYVIRDHKTNREYEDADAWKVKMQQMIYAMGVRYKYPDCTTLVWQIGYVNIDVPPVEWISPPEDDAITLAKIGQLWDAVKEICAQQSHVGDLAPFPETVHKNCGWCPVKGSCEQYRVHTLDFDISMMSILPHVKIERLEKLKLIEKMVKNDIAQLKSELIEQLKDSKPITHNGEIYSIITKESRVATFPEFWEAVLEIEQQHPQFVHDLFERSDDVLTVKVTGLDTLIRHAASPWIRDRLKAVMKTVAADEPSIVSKKAK